MCEELAVDNSYLPDLPKAHVHIESLTKPYGDRFVEQEQYLSIYLSHFPSMRSLFIFLIFLSAPFQRTILKYVIILFFSSVDALL